MGKILKWSLVVTISLAMVISGFAAGQQETKEKGGKGTIKLGLVLSLTGFAGAFGTSEKEAVIMAVEAANAAGGVNGKQIELFVEDDQSESSKAAIAATRLIKDTNVDIIIGGTLTNMCMPILPVVNAEKIPYIALGAGTQITDPFSEWVYRIILSDKYVGNLMLEVASKILKAKTAAVLYSTDASGVLGSKVLSDEAARYGLQVIASEKFEPNDTNMTAQLTKIKSSNPEIMFLWTSAQSAGIVAKNYRQLGLTFPVLVSHGAGSYKLFEVAGDAAEGWYVMASNTVMMEELPAEHTWRKKYDVYKATYEKRWGKPPDSWAANSYDAVYLLFDAIRKGGYDRASIREALDKAEFDGIAEHYRYSPTDHDGIYKAYFGPSLVQGQHFKILPEYPRD